MKHVREHIKHRQSQFEEIRLFEELARCESAGAGLAFVRWLSFFVMGFQDILRLNEESVRDPQLRVVARHHRLEDKGHDVWFLRDVLELDGSVPGIDELYSDANAATRDSTYRLMAEVLRATDDRARIALLLVLESTGHVFFQRVVDFLDRVGDKHSLYYFARGHLDIELGHELFEKRNNAIIDAEVLTDVERAEVLGAVDRAFGAMETMLDNLAERVRLGESVPPPSRQSLPPVSGTIPKPGAAIRARAKPAST